METGNGGIIKLEKEIREKFNRRHGLMQECLILIRRVRANHLRREKKSGPLRLKGGETEKGRGPFDRRIGRKCPNDVCFLFCLTF